jgi:hypothetical protein
MSTDIVARAAATSDLLFQVIETADLLRLPWDGYRTFVRSAGLIGNANPRPDQSKRLLVEVACFALFVTMMQEAPKWIRRQDADEPDAALIRRFNTALFERARPTLEDIAQGLHEIELGSVNPFALIDGAPLDARRRLAEHFKVGTTTAAAEEFAFLGALSIDAERAGVITPIVFNMVEAIVEVSRAVLKAAFAREDMT